MKFQNRRVKQDEEKEEEEERNRADESEQARAREKERKAMDNGMRDCERARRDVARTAVNDIPSLVCTVKETKEMSSLSFTSNALV
jgi:hypothetical protein